MIKKIEDGEDLRGREIESEMQLNEIISKVELTGTRDMLQWQGNNGQLTVKDLYSKIERTHQIFGL